MRKYRTILQIVSILLLYFFAFGVKAIASSPIPASSPAKGFPLKVLFNWHHQYEYAGFYAAQMQGYYQEAGLDVSLSAWNGQSVVDQVMSGDYQIGVDGSLLLADYLKGTPLKLIFSSFQYSPLVLLSHQPLNSLQDLRGKKLMFAHNFEIFALLKKAGLSDSDVTIMPHSANLEDFISNKVDFYSAYTTNEPAQLDEQGVSYYQIDPKTHGITTYGDFVFTSKDFAQQDSDKVQAFKQATLKGWDYALNHPTDVVDYAMAHYSVQKTRRAMILESNRTAQFVQTGRVPIGYLSKEKLLSMAYEMYSLNLVSEASVQSFKPEEALFSEYQVRLTQEERTYLKHNPVIKIANDIDWAPFEFIDQEGRYRGFAAEYLKLMSELLNVEFLPVKDKSWAEVVQLMKSGQLDIYSCAVATAERKVYADFTRPYLSFPMVFLAQDSTDYISDIEQLNGKTVAVVDGYATGDYLKLHHPKIKLLQVKNLEQGIEAVNQGKALAYAGNLAAISYKLKELGDLSLKVVGQVPSRFELAIGVAKGNEVLKSILQKALDSIPESEKARIYNDWLQLKVVEEYDYSRWIKWLSLVVLAFILILAFLGMQMRYQRKLQNYVNQINELNFATITDAQMNLIWVSKSLSELTGYQREELVGQPHRLLMHPEEDFVQFMKIWSRLEQGKSWRGEIKALKKNGETYWVLATAVPELNVQGKLLQVRMTREDISAKKRLEEVVVKDALTGLYNRRHFNELLPKELNRARREQRLFVMVMMDVDFFKNLNDTYGHQQGDYALEKISEVLQQQFLRSSDLIFRMGGEEFSALLTLESEQHLFEHLDQVRENVAALKIANVTERNETGILTLSVGAYLVKDWQGVSPELIYKKADEALYLAKDNGRNQVVILNTDC